MKDLLDRKTMKEFVELRAKTYNYIINDCSEDKKGYKKGRKGYKKMCHQKKTSI